ncbi:MAG: 1,4-beta-xylanase [Planctomycetota bacterium]|nr:MAG: 1,4-beta-xylanase [Planctomycetota bacterium]
MYLLTFIFPVLWTAFATSLTAAERSEMSLAQAFERFFPIGMGIGPQDLNRPKVWQLVQHHCRQVTIENHLKPSLVQPAPGLWTFERGDELVKAARQAGLRVHGHTLLWHRQSPEWMVKDSDGRYLPAEVVLGHIRDHIQGVMGHYARDIHSWDVVNEVLADGPSPSDYRQSDWYQAAGFDYILTAFLAAAEAQPQALLFYNDYGLETEPKRSRALRLIERLRAAGARVDGIGIQAHLQIGSPPIEEIGESIRAFAAAGLKVHISELDVSVHPWRRVGSELLDEDRRYEEGLTHETEQRLAQRYADLFRLFMEHHQHIWAVTFWNTHDGRSWLNNFPVRSRVDHPLLFDRQLRPKQAFSAVIEVSAESP